MHDIIQYIELAAKRHPDKIAIVDHLGDILTYTQVVERMRECQPLPLPLLGQSWTGDFHLTTTGTTGRHKTVVIPQRAVIANTENLMASHPYDEHTAFVICGELTHLGNWSKIFPTLFCGGTIILVESIKDINRFYEALDYPSTHTLDGSLPRGDVRLATFLVPANLRLLMQYSAERLAAHAQTISFIETGAAPISRDDMQRLCSLLPHTRLFNTYASTETGILCTYDFNDHICKSHCVGRPLPHAQVHITPEGRIAARGETLMAGYLDDSELTNTVLVDGTLTTSDTGYFDDEGMLHIQGRSDDILNVGGYKVNPIEVEQAALTHPDVADCICTTTSHPVLGPILKLILQMRPEAELDKRQIAHYLLERLERYKVPQLYEQVPSIKRTFNGKLDRKYYKD